MLEQRKIVALGKSSLVISLPKYWLNTNQLKRGDSVSLTMQRDRSLVVYPKSGMDKRDDIITLHIEANEAPISIVRRIVACYLNGYNRIRLISKNTFSVSQQKAIRNIIQKLYMSLMESGSKSMYIETLLDETRASIDSSVSRIHTLTKSMYNDVLNALRTLDGDLAKIVYSSDDDVDHFAYFILRLLNSIATDPTLANSLNFDAVDCLHYQTLAQTIEHIADQAKNIARSIIMLQSEPQKYLTLVLPILELTSDYGNEVVMSYDRAVKSFFSKNFREANNILETRSSLEQLNLDVTSRFFSSQVKSSTICCASCTIRDNLRGTMENAMHLARITIDRFYKKKEI